MDPDTATRVLRAKGKDPRLGILWTEHAAERFQQRGLLMGDVLHVLNCGFVYEEAELATRRGFYKYAMESTTPNSGGRRVRIVVIPEDHGVKLVTVMWADE